MHVWKVPLVIKCPKPYPLPFRAGSWIIVKNLPSKHVTEERLRDVFSRKGEITDVKLKRKSDGKSRQFAYIGFRTEQEAQDAITYVNKCFIDTYRISVEVADPPPREEGKVSPDGADEPNKAKISLLDSKKTRKIKVVALVGDDVSDMEYYKSRTKKNLSDSDSDCETYGCEDAIHVFPIDGDIEADRVDKEFTIHVFGFGHQDVVFLEPIEAREALKGMGVQALQSNQTASSHFLIITEGLPCIWAPGDILEPKALADNNENTSDVEENDVRRRLNLDQQVGIDSDITENLTPKRQRPVSTEIYRSRALGFQRGLREDMLVMVIEWKKVDNSMKAIRYRSAAKYVDQENNNPKKRKSSTVVG
ncbi:RNA recognition motif domain [Arabidopsis suecica]|uniref:RNA recognition motif domain n=1 Tax=Arabidopsis suecica TaxID=45249 RepID=A0A8T2DG88_ARASU|nr:RNA recognition motif domain [Arabidopsis suecica]